jgi:hypothetical protein
MLKAKSRNPARPGGASGAAKWEKGPLKIVVVLYGKRPLLYNSTDVLLS